MFSAWRSGTSVQLAFTTHSSSGILYLPFKMHNNFHHDFFSTIYISLIDSARDPHPPLSPFTKPSSWILHHPTISTQLPHHSHRRRCRRTLRLQDVPFSTGITRRRVRPCNPAIHLSSHGHGRNAHVPHRLVDLHHSARHVVISSMGHIRVVTAVGRDSSSATLGRLRQSRRSFSAQKLLSS